MSEFATPQKTGIPFLDPSFYFKVSAWALTAVALLGIVAWALEQTPTNQFLTGLGLHFTIWHNILHVVLAAACFLFGYASIQPNVVKLFAVIFGGVYLVLGVLGFFVWTSPDDLSLFALTPSLNIVHILLGGWALTAGLLARS